MRLSQKDFVSITDFTAPELEGIIDLAIAQKAAHAAGKLARTHVGRVLACIFHKPSLRTRVSFEVAMHNLGGTSLYLTDKELGVGTREAVEDVARVLSRYVDGVMIRTFDNALVEALARHATVPVINGLTDLLHPCQIMADLMTVKEHRGNLKDLTVVFIGDGNNVARSWVNASARLGFDFVLACPAGYGIVEDFVRGAYGDAPVRTRQVHDAAEAVREADVVYTDVWTSMGQEAGAEERRRAFAGFQINAELMARAPRRAVILHCLPAHRGEEITHEMIESEQSLVFDEAENRLHTQRALLSLLVAPAGGR
ncbi:MAG: ornithine carbamoyltransferase [Candidatus Krumholzibacteria bacterium]|nr:ornithine carbamoyltransferase [Candidatus Krumholzibacteria bacterium]